MNKPNHSLYNRRDFLQKTGKGLLAGALLPLLNCTNSADIPGSGSVRRFHISLSTLGLKKFPEIPQLAAQAGVTDVWLASFLYGRWYAKPEDLKIIANKLKNKYGFNTHIINVPLGHPGNALGVDESEITSKPPAHWKNACTIDGQFYSGTSIHPPAVKENVEAMKKIQQAGFDAVFLDDDFRIAKYPGIIGGCFCNDCRNNFLKKYGYSASQWEILTDSVQKRNPSDILRSWIDFWDDRLYSMFTAMQQAAPKINLGLMIMYFGSEKAGFFLDRYKNVPFRVGELMFSDQGFNPIKGKTDELFSSLFHRRFAKAELAYSETTAFPNDALSGPNIAAKLTISLISDVRNTMFMSGVLPFPPDRWQYIAPAMKKSAELNKTIAGHRPAGPFKHYWGWDSRLVGKDKPFSLFLASGIPFEVVDELPDDGWVFLSDEDAKAVAEKRLIPRKSKLLTRKDSGLSDKNLITINEDFSDIFALKNKIIPLIKGVPYIAGDDPVVFAWYPGAKTGLLWNVNNDKKSFRVMLDGKVIKTVEINPLDVEMVRI